MKIKNYKNRPLLVQKPHYVLHALMVLIALILLVALPVVVRAQNNAAKVSIYPRVFFYNGDTVAMVAVNQVRTINVVFNQRNSFRLQVKSLMAENDLLRQALMQKDTAVVAVSKELLIQKDVIKEREQQNTDFKKQYDDATAADRKTIRWLRLKNFGLISVSAGLLYLFIQK